MNGMTILITAYNQCQYVKLAIQSIRMFGDVNNLSVIVIDNGSEDALRDWASEQTDFTYIYMDEGRTAFGKVINEVKKELALQDDLLIMEAPYILTPMCLSRMQQTLYKNEAVGAVGMMSNGFFNYQRMFDVETYEQAIECARGLGNIADKRVLGLCHQAILFKAEALEQLGTFEESLFSHESVVRDYCFRMILNDWEIRVCNTALLWELCRESDVIASQEEKRLEEKWNMHYFNSMYNGNLINQIVEPQDAEIHVLEIGCDCGATLLEIKNRYPNARVYGSELNAQAADIASHVATVTINNIEEEDLHYKEETFDYIIFGDVLEHLRNPQKVILYCRKMLKENGRIIASIPNLMHISVMEQLLQGNFTYTETGLLDKTHIHFFTFNEIVRMFREAGYKLEEIQNVVMPISENQEELIEKLCLYGEKTEKWMYQSFQYILRANKKLN